MGLDTNIRGALTGIGAEVNYANQLKVVTETNALVSPENVGATRFFSENDPGTFIGTPKLASPETSQDYRLRVGIDSLIFDHTFSETSIDTSSLKLAGIAGMTSALSSGFFTLNASAGATGSGNYVSLQTQRYFRVHATSALYVEIAGNLTEIPILNQIVEMGLYVPTVGSQPQDGVWYQITSAGIIGVITYNGTRTETQFLQYYLTPNINSTYLIVVNTDQVEFWIDDVLYGAIRVPSGLATPFSTDSLPVTVMQRNSGDVLAIGQASLRVGDIGVISGDIASNRSWPAQMSGMGQHCSQGQSGGTMGTTASLPNAAAATVLTGTALSQTAAIRAAALGGQAGITAAVPGAEGLVFSYQNPVGSTTQPPRNLTIYGIRISAINTGAAVATTASTIQWALAYGATGATVPSLAQVEVNSLTASSVKSYRRIALGFSSFLVGAAIGAQAPDIVVTFGAPVTLLPGEWLAVTAKFIIGTATVSQAIWCTASFDGHFD